MRRKAFLTKYGARISAPWYLITAKSRTPARCVPKCGAGHCTLPRRNLAATKWRWGTTWIGCFSPVTYLDQRNITLIRPMIFATESEVKSAVYHAGLPIIKSRCPADGATVREQTKLFVQQMSRDDPAFRQKTLHALQQSGIDGWRPLHTGHTRG